MREKKESENIFLEQNSLFMGIFYWIMGLPPADFRVSSVVFHDFSTKNILHGTGSVCKKIALLREKNVIMGISFMKSRPEVLKFNVNISGLNLNFVLNFLQ